MPIYSKLALADGHRVVAAIVAGIAAVTLVKKRRDKARARQALDAERGQGPAHAAILGGGLAFGLGLVLHELRPYKAWDDWTLVKGHFALDKQDQQAAAVKADSKKKT
eukprot:jgi/Tetstr1/465675/TSEL_010318.t1